LVAIQLAATKANDAAVSGGAGEHQAFYERILEQTFGISKGAWLGTPLN
jgi:hypothetical protein